MKAGLKAHLASLSSAEKEEPITGKDLRKPGVYEKFVAERKAAHQPIPPGRHIEMAGHHWLKYNSQLTGSADQGEWIVAQWSPTQLCWYHSNDLASMAKPLYGNGLMTYWEYIAECPLPDTEVKDKA